MSHVDIARLVGRGEAEVQAALEQLINYGVCEIADDGTIYSRRMLRDENQRRSKVEAGRMGGRLSASDSDPSKSQAKRGSSSSSSSSSSTANMRGLSEVWGAWIEAGILPEQLTPSATDVNAVKVVVKDYSTEKVIGAIQRYAKILHGPEYRLETRWTLGKFLLVHLGKFFETSHPEKTYAHPKGVSINMSIDEQAQRASMI
jgi:hypothetical protein